MPDLIASTASHQGRKTVLSQRERDAIDHEITCYPERQAVCIEALKIVQQQRGWVSDEAIDAIADYLNMSPAEVDGVATFYNLIFRQRVGEKVILLCNSVSCWIMGCDKLKQVIEQQLNIDFGETSSDEKYTLLPITCLGDCAHAPVLMINDQHFGNVDVLQLEHLLNPEWPH